MSREPFRIPGGTLLYNVVSFSLSGPDGFKSAGGLLGLGAGCLMYTPPGNARGRAQSFICPLRNIVRGDTFQPIFGEAGIKGNIVPLAEGGVSANCAMKVTFRAQEFERVSAAWVVAYACEDGKRPVASLEEIAPEVLVRPPRAAPAPPAPPIPEYVSPSAVPQYVSPAPPQAPQVPQAPPYPPPYPSPYSSPASPPQQAAPHPQPPPAYPDLTVISPPASIQYE